MTSFYESEAWKKGDKGQRLVARWLADGHWWVVPSYDYSGTSGDKAPRMFSRSGQLVLPDLDACKDGRRIWVEVKTKDRATFHIKTRTLEHGFSSRHFEQYLGVEEISGTRVFILFVEMDGGRMLGNWLQSLRGQGRVNRSSSLGEMVFFPVSALKEVGWLNVSCPGPDEARPGHPSFA